jgi:hypothetical protein
VLVALTSAALVADRAGIEGIVGAFFCGLAINRPGMSPLRRDAVDIAALPAGCSVAVPARAHASAAYVSGATTLVGSRQPSSASATGVRAAIPRALDVVARERPGRLSDGSR